MSRKRTNILLRFEYEKWLEEEKNISPASISSYFFQDVYPMSGGNTEPYLTYFDVIANFIVRGDVTYAYTVLNEWEQNILNPVSGSSSSQANRKTYFSKIYEFFMIRATEYLPELGKVYNYTIKEAKLNKIRKSYTKGELAQLDAMDTLIKAVDEDSFIKLAVESSFFFDPKIVNARFVEIIDKYNIPDEKGLPARNWDESKRAEYKLPKNLYVFKDGNGNTEVCKLINRYTGYALNVTLDKKPFINNIISHIWGNATNPLFLTAFWNIVLIPAWANHLMDKPMANDMSLLTRLQSTFRAVCMKLYKMKSFDWSAIGMTCPDISYQKAVLHDTFLIRLICPGSGKNPKAGTIKTCIVKL